MLSLTEFGSLTVHLSLAHLLPTIAHSIPPISVLPLLTGLRVDVIWIPTLLRKTSFSISRFVAVSHSNLIYLPTAMLTLCHQDWAGASTTFAATCTGTCYTDYVVGDGSVYDTAYFDVASVKIYSTDGSNTIVSASASAASATSSSGAATSSATSWPWALLLGASVAVFGW